MTNFVFTHSYKELTFEELGVSELFVIDGPNSKNVYRKIKEVRYTNDDFIYNTIKMFNSDSKFEGYLFHTDPKTSVQRARIINEIKIELD